MKKRHLYKLELSNGKDAVIVYRTDNNYGRQGVVIKEKTNTFTTRHEYPPYLIPNYIIEECKQLINVNF